ncbi:hypothetical protein DFH27DRAFT_526665 [Peziza echinospora]|nr:hypothetical protein DFH27DRAFT_526665 [Peziza echinospora]
MYYSYYIMMLCFSWIWGVGRSAWTAGETNLNALALQLGFCQGLPWQAGRGRAADPLKYVHVDTEFMAMGTCPLELGLQALQDYNLSQLNFVEVDRRTGVHVHATYVYGGT